MQKFVKKRYITILFSILILLLMAVYMGKTWIFADPFKDYPLSEVIYASKDSDGNTLIANNSSLDVLKIGKSGKLIWKASASEDTFASVDRVVTDGQGNVYIHDVRIDQGVRIKREGIVKLNSEGRYISTILSFDAPRDCVRQMIVGIIPLEKGVICFKKSRNTIEMHDTNTGLVRKIKIQNAEGIVSTCAYDTESGDFFYLTYSGDVWV